MSELTPELKELLGQGQARLATLRRQAKERADDEERAQAEERLAAWAALDAAALALLPEPLRPYIVTGHDEHRDYGRPNTNGERVTIQIPGLSEILADLFWGRDGWRWNGHLAVPSFRVLSPGEYGEDDAAYTVGYDRLDPRPATDLPVILAKAVEMADQRAHLQAEADRQTAEYQAQAAANAAIRAQRKEDENERALDAYNAANAERAALLEFLEGDPVAMHLARLFAAVQREREQYQSQLDQAGYWAEEMESATARKIDRLRADVEDANRKADDARYEAEQATERARKLERDNRHW